MSFLLLVEQLAPETPSANQVVLYPKSDGLMYSKDDGGTERVIASVSATQAEQEAGSSVVVATTPGRQQFHPSALKLWGSCGVAADLNSPSYNITSVGDTGAGIATVTIGTDFSTAVYSVWMTCNSTSFGIPLINTMAAGSFVMNSLNTAGGGTDPSVGYFFAAAGDQA